MRWGDVLHMNALRGNERVQEAIRIAAKIANNDDITAEEAEFYMRHQVKNAFTLGCLAAGASRRHAITLWSSTGVDGPWEQRDGALERWRQNRR